MADPFASVAENYDIMIDWPARLARERPFFQRLWQGRRIAHVLDVGCGSGHHSRLFAEMGATVVGMDPSQAMLSRAQAQTTGENPRFVEGGFVQIPSLSMTFDLITVLGNTLSYARNFADLVTILRKIRRALIPGGQLCVQLSNYDVVLTENARNLPLIHRVVGEREYLFIREHRRRGKRVEFTITTLTRNGEWTMASERSLQYPITAEVLERALIAVGFSEITLYGTFLGDAFSPDISPALIAVAQNPD